MSFFLLGPRKLPFSCFPIPKKKDPHKTHHSPAAKTHKINTHRCGTQPPATAKPNTSPHSLAATTQNPTPHPRTPLMPKARDEQPPLLHASCRRCLPIFTPPPGIGLQCWPRTLIVEIVFVSSLISFEFC